MSPNLSINALGLEDPLPVWADALWRHAFGCLQVRQGLAADHVGAMTDSLPSWLIGLGRAFLTLAGIAAGAMSGDSRAIQIKTMHHAARWK